MAESCCESKTSDLLVLKEKQAHILKIVLVINLFMFAFEFTYGLIANSTALKADSLDMLGDAIVYGFSLYVLHKNEKWRSSAAFLKGLIIVGFAVFVLGESIYKLFYDVIPIAETMGWVGAMALVANTSCLFLLKKHRNDDLNMRSTYICSRNDIISNLGVLVAAVGVWYTQTKWPDIVMGFVIAAVFFKSAWPILTESIAILKQSQKNDQLKPL